MAKARIISLLITGLKPLCEIYLQYFIFTKINLNTKDINML